VIAESGLAALWLAGALAALQLILAALGIARNHDDAMAAVRPVAVVQGLLAVVAMALLITVFMRSDMSVLLVAANSHSDKPWLYKFAGAWGNHEGSMLLWVTILGVAGAAVALLEHRVDKRTLIATLGAQAAIALGFYAFLLFSSNPFARLNPAPADGNGLNTLGITAGSYWAYYELGWGGWWFWDPVENASLMPWLAATALLHSVTVLATRDGLRAWTVMLAVVAFSMSMIGTFLVRSGILTSVHAFAVDPERGAFILALLAIYIGGALILFAARVGTVRAGNTFEAVSREGALVVNNLLLSVVLGLVLWGTLYPIVAAAFGVQLSIGPPFFDKTAGPIALILVAIMGAGPLMRWRRDGGREVLRRMAVPGAAALVTLVMFLIFARGIGILPLLGLTLAAGLAAASVAPLWKRNLRRTPLFTFGMVIAHLGIAVSLAGMASDSAFTQQVLIATKLGEPQHVGPFTVTLDSIVPVVGPNYSALEATLTARRGDSAAFTLKPQSRFFATPATVTSESAIATKLDGQLYTVLGQQDEQGRWQLRLWWKPFVTFIWLGGALIALGGVLSLFGRLWRERRWKRDDEEALA